MVALEKFAGRFIPACAGNSLAGRFPPSPASGSSPRVRGTQPHGRAHVVQSRFIPACAGNSPFQAGVNNYLTVHPRVCGELAPIEQRGMRMFGSSPRVRGTPRLLRQVRPQRRFIPACAGNSRPPSRAASRTAVHPRVCGELQRGARKTAVETGSSPRVRGTRTQEHRPHGPHRFIPACAGNSRPAGPIVRRRAVHPRVCGELSSWQRRTPVASGSSPRVRGTHRPAAPHPVDHRFIPACAGNSRRTAAAGSRASVHPRVCGELRPTAPACRSPSGSSPRVRGTQRHASGPAPPRRFIPACAGNSTPTSGLRSGRSVHPRVCGELRPLTAEAIREDGSSPRVRGTPLKPRV